MRHFSQLIFSRALAGLYLRFVNQKSLAVLLVSGPLGVVLCLVLAGCHEYSLTGGPKPLVKVPLTVMASARFSPLAINEVAVLPLSFSEQVMAREFQSRPHPDLTTLTELLAKTFELHTNLSIVTSARSIEFDQAVAESAATQGPLPARAAAFGRRLKSQGVLCGILSTYVDSDGSAIGASTGARVAFKLLLVHPETAEVLWEAMYEDSNEPLSENLFRVPHVAKHGVRYKSAQSLLEEGFLLAARDLERTRNAAQ